DAGLDPHGGLRPQQAGADDQQADAHGEHQDAHDEGADQLVAAQPEGRPGRLPQLRDQPEDDGEAGEDIDHPHQADDRGAVQQSLCHWTTTWFALVPFSREGPTDGGTDGLKDWWTGRLLLARLLVRRVLALLAAELLQLQPVGAARLLLGAVVARPAHRAFE